MRRALGFALVWLLAFGTVSGSSWALYRMWLPPGRVLPGTRIEGQLQPEGVALGAWLEDRRRALLERTAYLVLPDEVFETTFAEIGIELDVAETLRSVREQAAGGSLIERLQRARRARAGQADTRARFSFDRGRARATLERLAPLVHRAPVDARLDLTAHRRIEHMVGRALDLEATLTEIAAGNRDDLVAFTLRTRPLPVDVTTGMLAQIDVSKVLAAFETDFGSTGRGRAVNIRTAAGYLNGSVLAPGQTLSFNKTVGRRVVERGFVWAPVINNDELEQGVGGGVCQVASTLHAAAVYGALDIVQRRSHSRPSGYAPLGLDATVIDGEVDLKLRNPYETPIIIHAFLSKPTSLRVELLGREPPGRIEHVCAAVQKQDFYRRVTTKPELAPGKAIRKQKGIFGYEIVSVVRIHMPDGTVKSKQYKSKYYPVPEVYWVAPGVSAAELPALPAGATHVDVDGEREGEAPASEELDNPYERVLHERDR